MLNQAENTQPGLAPQAMRGLARRGGSGLFVPEALAAEGGADGTLKDQAGQPAPVAYDLDGRRRVVLDDSTRKHMNRAIVALAKRGFGVVVGCREQQLPDGKPACGQVMMPEGHDSHDPGFGCKCSRIHWGR